MKYFLTLIILLSSWSAFSQSKVSYRFEVSISDEWTDWEEQAEELAEQGWLLEDSDEGLFVASNSDISIDELPISLNIADFEIRIFKTARSFKVSLDYIYGDYDGSAKSSAYLSTGAANIIDLSGGEHASGSWSVDAKAIVWLKE